MVNNSREIYINCSISSNRIAVLEIDGPIMMVDCSPPAPAAHQRVTLYKKNMITMIW